MQLTQTQKLNNMQAIVTRLETKLLIAIYKKLPTDTLKLKVQKARNLLNTLQSKK